MNPKKKREAKKDIALLDQEMEMSTSNEVIEEVKPGTNPYVAPDQPESLKNIAPIATQEAKANDDLQAQISQQEALVTSASNLQDDAA